MPARRGSRDVPLAPGRRRSAPISIRERLFSGQIYIYFALTTITREECMAKIYVSLLVLMLLVTVTAGTFQSQDGKAVVTAAVKAMGVENLKTIQISGSGSNAGIGQNVNPNSGWPTVNVKSYVRQIDLDAGASSVQ